SDPQPVTAARATRAIAAGFLTYRASPGASGAPLLGDAADAREHDLLDLLDDLERGAPLALPHVAAVDDARAARLEHEPGLFQEPVVVDLRAAGEHHQRAPCRGDAVADRILLGETALAVRSGGFLVLLGVDLRHVQLHHVGAHLHRHPGGVVDRVEGVATALFVDCGAAGVGPDDQRHAEAVAVAAHAAELDQVLVLARRADVERVADRVGAQPDRVLDLRVAGRQRLAGGGYLGFAVQLQDQRHLAGEVRVVLGREADLTGDR